MSLDEAAAVVRRLVASWPHADQQAFWIAMRSGPKAVCRWEAENEARFIRYLATHPDDPVVGRILDACTHARE